MSFPLPPSYPHLLAYASTSTSSSSASSSRSSRKPPSSHTAHDPDKADLRSIASAHSASTTHTQMSRSDTLKIAIHTESADNDHKVVRRAKCPPEFLEEIAKTGVPHGFKTRAECTFRVVSGLEAETLFEQFVGELDAGDQEKSMRHLSRQYVSHPVVFAFSLLTAGRKVVDYYMTWRGKIPRARDRRDRRLSFLDSDFRRLSRSLDKHYKSLISVVDTSSPIPEPARLPDTPKRHEQPSKPPPVHEESSDAASATASVVSLPLLNMIRNVPFGNRLPLRVTNPDTASILSDTNADDTETPAPPPRILETIAEATETTTAALSTESPTSVGRHPQPGTTDAGKSPKARHRSRPLKERPNSSHSGHSRSSPPDEEKSPGTGDVTSRSSPLKESPKSSHSRTSLPNEGKKILGSGDERSKRRHSSHNHKGDDERKHRSDDEASSKHSSRKHRHDRDKDKDRKDESDSDVASEFTIVLLDDNAEKDLLSWHGLNRTGVNATPHSAITPTDSPWTGPLVNANKLIFHTRARPAHVHEPFLTDDEDEDESDEEAPYEWHSPIMPHPKLFMDGPRQFASPAPPMPIPLTYSPSTASNYSTASTASSYSMAGTPAPRPSPVAYQTGYIYPVHHRSSASPYVPAWIDPRHYDPLAVMQSPLSYHTSTPF